DAGEDLGGEGVGVAVERLVAARGRTADAPVGPAPPALPERGEEVGPAEHAHLPLQDLGVADELARASAGGEAAERGAAVGDEEDRVAGREGRLQAEVVVEPAVGEVDAGGELGVAGRPAADAAEPLGR